MTSSVEINGLILPPLLCITNNYTTFAPCMVLNGTCTKTNRQESKQIRCIGSNKQLNNHSAYCDRNFEKRIREFFYIYNLCTTAQSSKLHIIISYSHQCQAYSFHLLLLLPPTSHILSDHHSAIILSHNLFWQGKPPSAITTTHL